ncbi:hypothetical protein GGI43DRAFT_389826 [Trichoderma evansii]
MYSVPLQRSILLACTSICTSVLLFSICDLLHLLHYSLNTIKSRRMASASGLVCQINLPNPCVFPLNLPDGFLFKVAFGDYLSPPSQAPNMRHHYLF